MLMISRFQNYHWESNLTKNSWRKHGKHLVANWTADTVNISYWENIPPCWCCVGPIVDTCQNVQSAADENWTRSNYFPVKLLDNRSISRDTMCQIFRNTNFWRKYGVGPWKIGLILASLKSGSFDFAKNKIIDLELI